MTLIEVLAGTLLVATILAVCLRTAHELRQQKVRADRAIRCTQEVDRLLSDWFVVGDGIPMDQEGDLSSDNTLHWRTSRVANSEVEKLGLVAVRLDVFDAVVASDNRDTAVLSLQLVAGQQSHAMEASAETEDGP